MLVGTRIARTPGVISFLHEILADLFRERPPLAVELLGACAGIRFEGARVERASIDLTQVAPTEYRSDAMSVLRDPEGTAIAVVIAEVQLRIDKDKRRTWPLYVAAARAGYDCPAILLVLAPYPRVAQWAGQPIELGHPGFVLQPIVIGFGEIPRIGDAEAARAAPELAVLSAMAHPELETAEVASVALDGLPEDKKKLYWNVILSGLPGPVRQTLEARMIKGYVYQSEFARKYFDEGLGKGREDLAKAVEEGRAEVLRRAIVALVCARLPALREELERRLQGQPEARLLQIITELDRAHDETAVWAAIDPRA